MSYNLSLINGSGVVPMLQTVNTNLMGGWYGNMMLISLFMIFFLTFHARTNNSRKSLEFSSLITAIFAVFLRTLELVPGETVIICWILTALFAAAAFIFPE